MALEKVLRLGTSGIDEVEIDTGTTKEVVTSARTYYVRKDGSNSNTGLVNNSAGAWLTVMHAVDFISTNLIVRASVTIEVYTGTYIENYTLGMVEGTTSVRITGPSGLPTNVKLQNSSSSSVIDVNNGGLWILQGLVVNNTHASTGYAVRSYIRGSIVTLTGVTLQGKSGQIYAANQGQVNISGVFFNTASLATGMVCESGGIINYLSNSLVHSSITTTYSDAFAKVSGTGAILFNPPSGTLTVIGTVNGIKFKSSAGGVFYPENISMPALTAGQFEDYRKVNILGTVSQTSGVPTGAIIERGSNANGDFIKFADGTMICTNNNAPITTDPAPFVGTVTSIDSNKLRIGRWF